MCFCGCGFSFRAHLSKDFYLLVKAIGESKSKQEEDRIIHNEVAQLKVLMGNRHLNKKRTKEFLIRLVYAEMLGHDASFGYIRAIELTASSLIIHKRTGYLCASLCLSPEHEFRFMMVNQLQRDMDNSNILVICAALTALCKLVTAEMIPALLQPVVKLMKHEQPIVRKKVVMALMRFWQLMPESVADHVRCCVRRFCFLWCARPFFASFLPSFLPCRPLWSLTHSLTHSPRCAACCIGRVGRVGWPAGD